MKSNFKISIMNGAIVKSSTIVLLIFSIVNSCSKSSESNITLTVVVLDRDARVPVSGAKVYLGYGLANTDSLITDSNGRVVFNVRYTGIIPSTAVTKAGWIFAQRYLFANPIGESRTDTVFW